MKKILAIVGVIALSAVGTASFGLSVSAQTGTTGTAGPKSQTPIKARTTVGASLDTSDTSSGPGRKADPKMMEKMEKKVDKAMEDKTMMEDKMRDKRDAMRDDSSTSNSSRGNDSNKVMERGIHGRIEVALKSLVAVHERLSQLGNRIEERIKKLSAGGVNVEMSQKFLASARADLSKAKTEIENARSAFKTELAAVSSNTSASATVNVNTSFPKTLAAVQAAKAALKSAHSNLVSATRGLAQVSATSNSSLDKSNNTPSVR